MTEREKLHGVVLLHEPVEDRLNERQVVAYREHRRDFINWLATRGKDPDSLEGYAGDTFYVYANVVCQFHRFVWDDRGFTLGLTHDDARDYIAGLKLSDEDYSRTHLNNSLLALKAYFRWKGDEWDSSISFETSSGASQPRNFVTAEERQALEEAVLEYGSVPAYAALSPEKREEWTQYLARRYGKPMNDVTRDDWDRANGFKYVSILFTSLDAALRPVEVGRARASWVDVENAVLRIPEDQSAKNEDNWTVSLRRETAQYLTRWLEERELYDKYDDTDRLWLTRHRNPYNGKSLRVLLDNLREIAGIERDFTWYAIRHSTGTYMAREEGLAAAQAQLRHHSIETTTKYDQAPPEDRRDALDRIG